MMRDRAETVAFASHAVIRSGAPPARLSALVAELEQSGATVELAPERSGVLFTFPYSHERWILLGGLGELLARFEDVVTWEPGFEELWGTDEGDNGPKRREHPV